MGRVGRIGTAAIVAAVSFVATGCCGECDDREGRQFRIEFTETDGNCGDLQDETLVLGGSNFDDADAVCSRLPDASKGCETVWDKTVCPGATGYEVSTNGSVDWDCDGSSAEGSLTIGIFEVPSDLRACQSTYDVTYEEL
jgi:hypothetical protein